VHLFEYLREGRRRRRREGMSVVSAVSQMEEEVLCNAVVY
jgi:hypothetical protein